MQGEKVKMFYYGLVDNGGHGFVTNFEGGKTRDKESLLPARLHMHLPGEIDGGLCREGRKIEGVAMIRFVEGWTVLSFWDQSGDSRPGSNSNFIAEGRRPFAEMCALAKEWFPAFWERAMRRFDVMLDDECLDLLPEEPMPALLYCPRCGLAHVDEGEWSTRLHHMHQCSACEFRWRVEPYCCGIVPATSSGDGDVCMACRKTIGADEPMLRTREGGYFVKHHVKCLQLAPTRVPRTFDRCPDCGAAPRPSRSESRAVLCSECGRAYELPAEEKKS